MPAVQGIRGTGDWGTDERPKDFRESILFFTPNGNAPIFALTSKAGKKTVKDPEFSWWAESNTVIRVQVNGALGSGDTVVTVDSPDPDATNMGILYGLATHLKPGDILSVGENTNVELSTTFAREYIQVDSVISATAFNAVRGVAGTTPAAIPDNSFLTVIGSAYAEGTAAPKAVSRNPVKFFNYTQIFKDTYELTATADQTETRTGNSWSNDKKRKSFDHARNIEMMMLFGKRFETVGSNGKPLRYAGGIRTFLPAANVTIFANSGGGFNNGDTFVNALINAVKPAFDFDVGGGDTRFAYCGNQARLTIGQGVQAQAAARLEFGNTVKVYGQDFQELITPLGRLLLKSHPLMSAHPMYANSMHVIDFAALKYTCLRGRDTKTQDDVQTKDEDLRRGFVQTECSVMVDGGGLSMVYLGNINRNA
jgi:hypothetical protein